MQPATFFLTKHFFFSASFEQNDRVFGHNYEFSVTLKSLSVGDEETFEARVKKALIEPMHSKDLSLHVDFLKGIEINDSNLLKVFWKIIHETCPTIEVQSMNLKRNKTTETRMVLSNQ